MGWEIVRHSFAMLFRNLGNALRISVGPMLIGVVAVYVVVGAVGVSSNNIALAVENGEMPPAVGIALLLVFLIMMFIYAWIAVAWHRYILLEDYPGILPSISGRPVWQYIGKIILLFLVVVLSMIPAMIVFGVLSVTVARVTPGLVSFLGIGLTFYIAFMLTRFGVVLPATAVSRPMGFIQAWRATGPYVTVILGTTVIVMLINGVISSVGSLFPWPLAVITSLAANWISIMLGISILTTLYGVIVERRTL